MKKLLLAIALVLAVASAQAITVGAAVLSDTQLAVVVTGAGTPAVEVLDVVLTFSPSLVPVQALEGQFIKKQGGPIFALEDSGTPGVWSYTVARLGPVGSTGSGTGALFDFESGLNTTNVHYVIKLIDAESNDIIVAEGDTLQVQPAVPEPMTLALVAGALAGLGLVARKRS